MLGRNNECKTMKEKLSTISAYCIDKLIKILLILVPLFFVFGKGENYYFSIYDIFKESIIESIAALLAGFYLLKIYAEDEVRVKYSPLLWPLLLLYVSIFLSMLQAYNIYEAFIFVRQWTANFIILFVVYNFISDKKRIRCYLNYLIFIGGIVSCYGILQHLKIDFSFLHQNFVGNSTFGNPNFASEFILMVFPIALLLVFANVHAGWFLYYGITAILLFIFLIFNKSRAVWIGGGVAGMSVVMYLIYNYLTKRIRYHVGKNEKKHALFFLKNISIFIGVGVVIIILSLLPLAHHNKYLKQFRKLTKQVVIEISTLKELKLAKGEIKRGDTATQRILIWRNALGMIKNNSILGVGIGNFKIEYQPYRTKEEQLSTGPDIFVRRSHNEYVQLLSEIGLFGIIFFFWVIIMTVRMCTTILKRSKDFYGQCLAIGFLVSFVSTYIAIFFNFSLQTPTPCMTLWFITSLMMVSYDIFLKKEDVSLLCTRSVRAIKNSLRTGVIIIVICCFILPYWLVRPAQAYYHYQYGQALEKMGLTKEAKHELKKSLRYFYHSWEVHFVLANVYAALGELNKSKEEHLFSLQLNPYHQKGHYNLANTLYKLGDVNAAIEHYLEAIRIDEVFYQAFNNLGSIYYKEGKLGESLKYFKGVVELDPTYPSGQYNMGYVLFLLKRYKEALPYLQNAYRLQPGDVKIKKLIERTEQNIR